jgi:hypothetical protein
MSVRCGLRSSVAGDLRCLDVPPSSCRQVTLEGLERHMLKPKNLFGSLGKTRTYNPSTNSRTEEDGSNAED